MPSDNEKAAMVIALKLWNMSAEHSDHKKYDEYKKIYNQLNSKDEEFGVTVLLQISNLIDAYTWQITNKPVDN